MSTLFFAALIIMSALFSPAYLFAQAQSPSEDKAGTTPAVTSEQPPAASEAKEEKKIVKAIEVEGNKIVSIPTILGKIKTYPLTFWMNG